MTPITNHEILCAEAIALHNAERKARHDEKAKKRGKIHEQRRADKKARERARKALLRYIDNINNGVPYAEKGRR